MDLKSGHLFHIYNQGNNKQRVFFTRENYLFFLKKVESYLLPYVDLLAWCLMPNHFHLMVLVKHEELLITEALTRSESLSNQNLRTLNDSFGIMLRSYTRAINNQEYRTGSLFRRHTKAECLTQSEGIAPSFFQTQSGTMPFNQHPELQYPQQCFNYIHRNPVEAGLVRYETDWEFSSARDYAGLSRDCIINKEIAKKYIDIT